MVGKVHLFYENLPESCEKKFSSLIAVKRFGYLTIELTGILGIARKNDASFFASYGNLARNVTTLRTFCVSIGILEDFEILVYTQTVYYFSAIPVKL